MSAPSQSTPADTDRREAIERPELARAAVLVPGVELRVLAGAQSGARHLFTGLLTLGPGVSYPLYTRTFSETLILLEGTAAVDVEERRYRMGFWDGIILRERLPRKLVNLSTSQNAVFHVSLASATPEQTWVNGRFTPLEQPPGATGRAGAERVVRNDPALRVELAPRALFQDLFNAELGAQGICGGYGVFEPGARLPCHRHEFDESITIVQGTATCIVEGRRHELSNNATATVPRGRCHYFINLTLEPMAMIWVYAGDMPDRIVVDEVFCHPEKANVGRR
jgi:quercetin dioxygenase-like cupin family protein